MSQPNNNPIKDALTELSHAYEKETQEQYSTGQLSKILLDKVMPLAYGSNSPTMKQLSIVWASSRMSNKDHTALTLRLIADSILDDDDDIIIDQVKELQAELEQRQANREAEESEGTPEEQADKIINNLNGGCPDYDIIREALEQYFTN